MANTDLFLDKPDLKGSTPGISQSKFLSGFQHGKNHTLHFLLSSHLGRQSYMQLNTLPMNYKEIQHLVSVRHQMLKDYCI